MKSRPCPRLKKDIGRIDRSVSKELRLAVRSVKPEDYLLRFANAFHLFGAVWAWAHPLVEEAP